MSPPPRRQRSVQAETAEWPGLELGPAATCALCCRPPQSAALRPRATQGCWEPCTRPPGGSAGPGAYLPAGHPAAPPRNLG